MTPASAVTLDVPPESVSVVDHEVDTGISPTGNAAGDFERDRYMGSRDRVEAAYGFSWDAVAEQTERIYSEVV